MSLKDILHSHSKTALKKEISKTNIRGFTKMSKEELVAVMLKHPARFSHIKMNTKTRAAPVKKVIKVKKEAPKPKPATPKPAPPKPRTKISGDIKEGAFKAKLRRVGKEAVMKKGARVARTAAVKGKALASRPVQGPRNLKKGFGIKRIPKKEEPKPVPKKIGTEDSSYLEFLRKKRAERKAEVKGISGAAEKTAKEANPGSGPALSVKPPSDKPAPKKATPVVETTGKVDLKKLGSKDSVYRKPTLEDLFEGARRMIGKYGKEKFIKNFCAREVDGGVYRLLSYGLLDQVRQRDLTEYNVIVGPAASKSRVKTIPDIDVAETSNGFVPMREINGVKVIPSSYHGALLLGDYNNNANAKDKYGDTPLPVMKAGDNDKNITAFSCSFGSAGNLTRVKMTPENKKLAMACMTDYGADFVKDSDLVKEKESDWGPYSWGLIQSWTYKGKKVNFTPVNVSKSGLSYQTVEEVKKVGDWYKKVEKFLLMGRPKMRRDSNLVDGSKGRITKKQLKQALKDYVDKWWEQHREGYAYSDDDAGIVQGKYFAAVVSAMYTMEHYVFKDLLEDGKELWNFHINDAFGMLMTEKFKLLE